MFSINKDGKISIATGGYSRELHSMKIMEMVDTNCDHKVTKDELIAYQDTLFTVDKSADKQIDGQEWLAEQTGN